MSASAILREFTGISGDIRVCRCRSKKSLLKYNFRIAEDAFATRSMSSLP